MISLTEIEEHWVGLGLSPDKFTEIVTVGKFPATIEWPRFVIVACGRLSQVSVKNELINRT